MTTTIIGAGTDTLGELAAGKGSFADVLKNAQHPIVLVGAGATARHDGAAMLALAAKLAADVGAIKDGWNGFARAARHGLARRRARYRLCCRARAG